MADDFTQRGGARIGHLNATWPFALLVADSEKIELSVVTKKVFPKDKIIRLSPYRTMFSTGLRIEHVAHAEPSFIVFWTFDFETLKANLIRLGYDVAD